MSDLRPERCDCQTTLFTKNLSDQENFLHLGIKLVLLKYETGCLLLPAFSFKRDMKNFHATS